MRAYCKNSVVQSVRDSKRNSKSNESNNLHSGYDADSDSETSRWSFLAKVFWCFCGSKNKKKTKNSTPYSLKSDDGTAKTKPKTNTSINGEENEENGTEKS